MIRKPLKKLHFYLKRSFFNPWVSGSVILAGIVSIPLIIILVNFFYKGDDVWQHVSQHLLPGYVSNTVVVMTGVAIVTFIMGVSTAWITSVFDFPGRRFFTWALIMPISLPAYISGFTWAGILDYTSPVYVFFRENLGIETGQHLFFDILSMHGAIIIFSLALYPYVYLITRSWFRNQSSTLLDAAASMGHTPGRIFFTVALPLARPAVVAGVSLALMEVLNDYGLVRYFGVDTFSTGIFTAWFAFSNPGVALKLSAWLLLFVFILLIAERVQRGKMRYDSMGSSHMPLIRKKAGRVFSALYFLLCFIPFLFGFLLPVLMLIYWGIKTSPYVVTYRFWELLGNSFMLATTAALLVTTAAIIIAFTLRSYPSKFVKGLSKTATLGYALPGAVVAIGIMVSFIWLDHRLSAIVGANLKVMLTGTWVALIFAYMVRFMAVGFNSIESGMQKVSVHLDEAARTLGYSLLRTLWQVNVPLLKGPLLSAVLLVFIDVLKELPLTMILRPFNFDTLAIRAFEFASDERIAEAAPAAIVIVMAGIAPVILLNRIMNRD